MDSTIEGSQVIPPRKPVGQYECKHCLKRHPNGWYCKYALQAERDEGYEAGQSDMRKENRRLKEELQDLRDEMEEELSEAVHLLRRPTFSSASFIKKHSGEI